MGDDDPEMRLKLMEGYLKPYKKKKVKSAVPLARPFKRPKKLEIAYDAADDPNIDKKHYLVVNWLLPDTSDPVLNFSLRILGHILIGTPASPLKKALLDFRSRGRSGRGRHGKRLTPVCIFDGPEGDAQASCKEDRKAYFGYPGLFGPRGN